ncbi:energy-coupling factor transporter transmembrane component T family protein [Sporolactobacillus inulinus]|uniref:Cobalt ABC transporter ATP-binding protein n=2 Tax=Sporolactobacillus inulinus TaxID=2078 RepID=A0A0U1QSC6_9BACL|nr:energy-coupling factor transporter transmembrane component T [Sporolactobacillus inulinus]KLI03707.1 cobalt ABC transporter ATP-binding protein [Sporolactobacillus inulinus CASD]GEB77367.1 energy-coupling factor transporter transmembrane protein EcfT [Sporolactobacillus inulinus]
MNRLILGRYFPGDSVIHRRDPRAKILCGAAFIFISFLAKNMEGLILLWMFAFGIMFFTKISFRTYFRGLRPLFWLILFTVCLQILFTSGGTLYWRFGPIKLSSFGIVQALFIFTRFVTIIFVTTAVTLTTKPMDLTDGLHALLRPLRLFHLPVDEWSMMLSIALRFIPNLLDETQRVMDAQSARGAVFGEGSLFQQMKALVPIFLPLFAGSLARGEELANVMDVRGYRSELPRSSFRRLKWTFGDTCCLLIMCLLIVALAAFNLNG